VIKRTGPGSLLDNASFESDVEPIGDHMVPVGDGFTHCCSKMELMYRIGALLVESAPPNPSEKPLDGPYSAIGTDLA
jgi:hypothetical protein